MKEKLESSIVSFISWLERNTYESYDVYDFWSSSIGIKAKRYFNANKLLASPLVGVLQVLDSFFPRSRFLFAKKKRFPIADSQFASAYLNYYLLTKDEVYLSRATGLLKHLESVSSKTKHGIGWGNPYDWVTLFFEYPSNSPLITVTPYCFDAFLSAYEITSNESFLRILEKISMFVAFDMKETEFQDNTAGCSYGTNDNSLVYNAIAYRGGTLLKAGRLFKNDAYIDKSRKNIDYVIKHQNKDGSWYYSDDSRFIDNFHTCFVLKNIAQAYDFFGEDYMLQSLKKGYEFYKKNFVRTNGSLRHFYKSKYPKFRKIELYDYAEAIKMGIFMRKSIPEAFSLSKKLTGHLIDKYQLKEGYFYTRVNVLNMKNDIPYLRWPQAQILNSLTSMLLQLSDLS